MNHILMLTALLTFPLGVACSGDDDADDPGAVGTSTEVVDDRAALNAEASGVLVEVADCFVVEVDDGRRYQTTVEVRNESEETHMVAVTIVAESGRGGTSAAFEVPGGAADAWAVTADDLTDDPAGDAVCEDYIIGVELAVDTDAE